MLLEAKYAAVLTEFLGSLRQPIRPLFSIYIISVSGENVCKDNWGIIRENVLF